MEKNNKSRVRIRKLLAQYMGARHLCLIFSLVFLMSMVWASGCKPQLADGDNGQNQSGTVQDYTEALQEGSAQADGEKSSSPSDGEGQGSNSLSSLPLISSLRPDSETDGTSDTARETAGETPGDSETNGASGAVAGNSEASSAGEIVPADSQTAGGVGDESGQPAEASQDSGSNQEGLSVVEDGKYNTKDEVALYIHLFGHLPSNYITKSEAEELGWNSRTGNLAEVAPGMSIGGNHFGNYEKKLPSKEGRTYFECDINYNGGYRGSERIIFSSDGLVFYTNDHYESFEQLY